MALRLNNSLIQRFATAMGAISLMAIVSIFASVIVAQSTRGDAAGINQAGSLRMQSYRIATFLERLLHEGGRSDEQQTLFIGHLDEMQVRLESEILTEAIPVEPSHELNQSYQQIITDWNERLRPLLIQASLPGHGIDPGHLPHIQAFVDRLNAMVSLMEKSTESKIRLLAMVQVICLLLTLVIICVSLFDAHLNLVVPLRQLVGMANRASRGDFSQRTAYRGDHELALLGRTFDTMAEELSKMYSDLESRVAQKTSALEKSNANLQFLYDTAQRLNHEPSSCKQLWQIVHRLQETTGFDEVALRLNGDDGEKVIGGYPGKRPDYCQSPGCNICMSEERLPKQRTASNEVVNVPIEEKDNYFGHLLVFHDSAYPIDSSKLQLVTTVANNIATALSLNLQAEHQQHLSLIEERTVIARELHDSLAQSLSYLKIQVARLQKYHRDGVADEKVEEVTQELKEGLSSAYRQLRELLTTFRLKLSQPGLEPALNGTVTEFSERLNCPVILDYRLGNVRLSPNEEIHVLQVVREALANTVKHAQATQVSIRLASTAEGIRITVEDDGKGLPPIHTDDGHYGLIIMRDRAQSLNGELSIEGGADKGTRVELSFVPKSQSPDS